MPEHRHEWMATGIRRSGPLFAPTGTMILYRCDAGEDRPHYDVTTVPGVWTVEQLGIPGALDVTRRPADRGLGATAAGAVAMSKTTAAVVRAEEKVVRGSPRAARASAD